MNLLILNFLLFLILIIPQALSNEIKIKNPKPEIKAVDKFKVFFLEPNSTFNFKPSKRGFFETHLNTYCYSGEAKTLGRLLETIELQFDIEGDDYTQYDGSSPAEVEEHYSEHRSIFNLNLFSQKRSRVSLSPFRQQCIGIETNQPYNVTLYREKMDYYRLAQLFCGILLFLFAGVLSTNSLFYYITGILFGICSSFLFLIWLSGKLMPKRTMMYGVLIGGWTVGFYVIRLLWDNLQMIMMTYRNYVCWYIVITGIISFFLCYRWGPPKNRRSKNIIKWLLQLIALVLIYFSSNFYEAAIAIMIMTFVLCYFPKVLKRVMSLRTKTSSSKKRDNVTTTSPRKKELREDCQQWRLNSPQYKDWNIKPKGRPSLNSNMECLTPKERLSPKQDDIPSGSDVSIEEHDLTKKKLYPLGDGSFILSEKPPIIITPHHVTPIYHRSATNFLEIEQDEGDNTPKNHHTHVPLPAHTRRLTAAASTSDLLSARHRRATPSPSHLQRSTSAQRVQSRSARKHHSSNPKIKIENPTTDDES